MPHKRLLVIVSIIVLVLALVAAVLLPTKYSSAVGSLFGAGAGMLAVIWFSAGLYYQSQQLKEQRQQFLENFKQLQEDNRRNSLVLVRDILSRAEERALKSNPDLKSINDLMTQYINMLELSTTLKSTDPNTVLVDGKNWLITKEGPALFLMRGIKSAAETYFRATGESGIDYTLEPELFVAAYGPTLWEVPYFEEYRAAASFLSEWMVKTKPIRAAVELAYWVAALKQASSEGVSEIMNTDKIIEDVKQHLKAGYPLPEIAKDFANDLGKDSPPNTPTPPSPKYS